MTLVQKELKNAYIWMPNPTSIFLDKNSISLTTVWQTEQLTATIEPTISDHSITWNSDDTTVATVSTTGLVTCVTPWECTITATTVNGLTATCSVSEWWQPWANTIAYYPLDTDFNDASGNWFNLTGSNWAIIWTLNWVSCLDLTASNSYVSWTVSWLPQWSSVRTNMLWIYGNASWQNPWYQYWTSSFNQADVLFNLNPIGWSQYWGSMMSSTYGQWAWHHVAVVIKWTWSAWQELYIDGQLATSWTMTVNTNWTTLYLGRCTWDGTYLDGYISKFIVENKVRTAQEVADYYNQTKWNYGL